MRIGSTLRKAREEAGYTQTELGEAAGIHRTYLSDLERDRKSPTLDVFVRICRALKISPTEMMANLERANRRSSR